MFRSPEGQKKPTKPSIVLPIIRMPWPETSGRWVKTYEPGATSYDLGYRLGPRVLTHRLLAEPPKQGAFQVYWLVFMRVFIHMMCIYVVYIYIYDIYIYIYYTYYIYIIQIYVYTIYVYIIHICIYI